MSGPSDSKKPRLFSIDDAKQQDNEQPIEDQKSENDDESKASTAHSVQAADVSGESTDDGKRRTKTACKRSVDNASQVAIHADHSARLSTALTSDILDSKDDECVAVPMINSNLLEDSTRVDKNLEVECVESAEQAADVSGDSTDDAKRMTKTACKSSVDNAGRVAVHANQSARLSTSLASGAISRAETSPSIPMPIIAAAASSSGSARQGGHLIPQIPEIGQVAPPPGHIGDARPDFFEHFNQAKGND